MTWRDEQEVEIKRGEKEGRRGTLSRSLTRH